MSEPIPKRRVVIVGAAGRDFHNFNMAFRRDPSVEVVAFTGAQIPGITKRSYPKELAGPNYPDGIPIVDERELDKLCADEQIDQVVFAYSDVSHSFVMDIAARALAGGADFAILGPKQTMLQSSRFTISVCAARTGVGKSQTTRWIANRLKDLGLKASIIRHPMPYGDLQRQAVQTFRRLEDLDTANCTLEEREEYEPHLEAGHAVYAGVDFERILRQAEIDTDVILWDGGNNDFSFLRPDLAIALVDPFRAADSSTHHPGETVVRMADIVAIAKANAASPEAVEAARLEAVRLAPHATILKIGSKVRLDDPNAVKGRRVVVVEDGPTTTHGGMPYGAGFVAAKAAGVSEIIDPRPYAQGTFAATYDAYPHLGPIVPALGYSAQQRADLASTLEACPADLIICGTPIDLARLAHTSKPVVRARYDLDDFSKPSLTQAIDAALPKNGLIR